MNINKNKFRDITANEYLNYIPYQKLEETLAYSIPRILDVIKKKFEDVNSDEALEYFLTQNMLKLCVNQTWLKISKENNLTTDYLYICLKRSFVFHTTK